jgi:hypothetical protein
MNFALDLGAGMVAGVAADVRRLIRDAGGDPDDAASSADAINRVVFGRTLTQASLGAAGRVSTSGRVPVSTRVAGLLFAGPEMQVR